MKYIISAAQGGISNRIRCLLNCMKFSEDKKIKLILFWEKTSSCNCIFNDLFETKINEIRKENLKNILNKSRKFLVSDNVEFSFFTDEDIYLKYNKIPKRIRDEILHYLLKLKIRKEFLDKVKQFSKKFSKNTVGVHIRRGDFKILESGLGKVSTEEIFVREMKNELERNPKANFFLSTDDKECENNLKKIFPNKIIIYSKKTISREQEGSVEEALIDLLLLSKTQKLMGTYGSTFSEMAWLFGNCKQEVIIPIDKTQFENYHKKANKKSLIKRLKKVIYELLVRKEKRFFRVKVK